MPCPWDFPHVDPGSFCLPEARVDTWGGFVFVTMDAGAPSLASFLEILPEHFAPWPLADRYLTAHVVRTLPCNWKVALEAFIESYHTVAVHPQLLTTSGDTQTEYDVYPGVRHVNRMITPVGIASEHVDHDVAEQDIVDAMFLTRDDPDRAVPDGSTARHVLAARTRRRLTEQTGADFSAITDSEALDAIEYFVFPNFMPWAGYTTPLTYRFRPNGTDHRSSVMDVMLLEPLPAGGTRPAPAPTRHLTADQSWADAPELGYLGRILNQDTATLARVQQGLQAVDGPDVTLARYQENRIRHFHRTLGLYLDG
jgi:phenylpropionate dioxygenase-like ring-hydroxylating dioxygenase large terminal subunit